MAPRLQYMGTIAIASALLGLMLVDGGLPRWGVGQMLKVAGEYSKLACRGEGLLTEPEPHDGKEQGPGKTLVVYVYYESSAHYRENLAFFTQVAISPRADPRVDYLLVVNGQNCSVELGGLPSNVQVVRRENTCYDGGAMGEVLQGLEPRRREAYRYFVLLNSSVRGPFMPRYWPRDRPWTEALTSLLTEQVKLVGSTISCELGVHVQSMVLATDRVGMSVLQSSGALECPSSLYDAIQRFERGSTRAIFAAGYTIDCLMSRYRGVDWRADSGVECNGSLNPTSDLMNDGMNMNPFEVLFVKAKPFPVMSSTHMLRRYTDYYMGRDDVRSSEYQSARIQDGLKRDKQALLDMVKRCQATFDVEYYVKKNNDLAGLPLDLWKHFIENGFVERRPYRFVPVEAMREDEACMSLAPAGNELR